jgi:hypothetical protein
MSFVPFHEDLFSGEHVVLKGLNRVEYNGLRGNLLAFNTESERWYVRVAASPTAILRIKGQNLEVDEMHCKEMHVSAEDYVGFLRANHQKMKDLSKKYQIELNMMSKMTSRRVSIEFELSDSLDVRLAFSQLQKLWSKYGDRFTAHMSALPIHEAVLEVSEDKLLYLTSTDAAGSQTSEHVHNPAGRAPDALCLLPELHTFGPSFAGLSVDQVLSVLI